MTDNNTIFKEELKFLPFVDDSYDLLKHLQYTERTKRIMLVKQNLGTLTAIHDRLLEKTLTAPNLPTKILAQSCVSYLGRVVRTINDVDMSSYEEAADIGSYAMKGLVNFINFEKNMILYKKDSEEFELKRDMAVVARISATFEKYDSVPAIFTIMNDYKNVFAQEELHGMDPVEFLGFKASLVDKLKPYVDKLQLIDDEDRSYEYLARYFIADKAPKNVFKHPDWNGGTMKDFLTQILEYKEEQADKLMASMSGMPSKDELESNQLTVDIDNIDFDVDYEDD